MLKICGSRESNLETKLPSCETKNKWNTKRNPRGKRLERTQQDRGPNLLRIALSETN